MKPVPAALSLVLALIAAPAAFAQTEVACPKTPGMFPGPFVRDPEAAQGIFVAVADQFQGGEDFSGYQIKVEESADHRSYLAYHYMPGVRGGGMAMTIDRCTGRITKLRYQR
ncbi:hypothetical protein P1X14_00940 [Sphingomonas sp. AOB5]|uniref:hypothetical protein n=1 Tax=Sphingomonas sp. AOB5 TaxID=3034017 RepID=UPI0023F63CB9|nr:hypothetical protein [Sphingomonas sp. AOB5]MDF7773798.1 hypothetical protein [Sphingomonas sp. AOB5]